MENGSTRRLVRLPLRLSWGSLGDPQIEFFSLGFGAPRDLNAECHACAAVG
jgi:hypothetical protein